MSVKIPIKNYKAGMSVEFPLPTDKKNKDWYKKWGEAAVRLWAQGKGSTGVQWLDEADELRAYAEGNQPVEKYKDSLAFHDRKTKERRMYTNISWDNVSVMPKILESAINNLMGQDYDVGTVALDESAANARMHEKHKLIVQSRVKQLYEAEGQAELAASMPDNIQQIELMSQSGGIKLGIEIASDMLVMKTLKDSDWDDNVKKAVLKDLFTLAMGAVKDRVDIAAQEVKVDYVDPKYLIIPYSKDHTYADAPFIGYIEFISEQKFKREAIAAGKSEKEVNDKLMEARKSFKGGLDQYSEYHQVNVNEVRYESDTGIPVLRLEIRDEEREQLVERKKGDKTILIREDYNPRAKNTDKRKFHKRTRPVIRVMNMVLGLDYVYGEGIKKDMAYKGKMPMFSYHVYKTSARSKVSQCISLIDDMQLAILRMRVSQANAMPNGVIFDIDSLMNINMGGKDWDPLETIKLLQHTGRGVYKSTGHRSQYQGTSAMPMIPIEGGTGKYFDEQKVIVADSISMISEITGVNEFMQASMVNKDTPVGNQEQLMASSSIILRSNLLAYKSIKERLAMSIIKRWQIIAKNKKLVAQEAAVGSGVIAYMEVGDDFPMYELGIYASIRPSEQEKANIMRAAEVSVAASRQGGIGISMEDYFYLSRLLEMGNTKLAQVTLSHREELAKKRHEDLMRENQQMSQMSGAELEKEKRQTVALQQQGKKDEIALKGQIDRANNADKISRENAAELKEIDRQKKWDMQIARQSDNNSKKD